MKRLLLASYEWILRVVFILILAFTALVLSMTFLDFASFEKHIIPLQLLKSSPRKVDRNVWVGPYLYEEKLLKFVKTNRINLVVALLDESMNHERSLIDLERKLLKKRNIKFFTVSTKPFLEEESAKRKLKKILLRNRNRRIYVHSYLGRVRVRLVEEILHGRKDP